MTERNLSSIPDRSCTWLSGLSAGQYHLLDTRSGRVVKTLRIGHEIRPTAGVGHRCGGRFVAWYVDPGTRELVVQAGDTRLPLDGETKATHSTRAGGFLSRLRLERPGAPPLELHQYVIGGTVQRWINPGYDELDRSCDDFLLDIADVVDSESRRAHIGNTKDPTAGPWDALG